MKELYKYLTIFFLFGALDFLYGNGLNVLIKSGETISVQKEILGLNYLKKNESTDEVIFETDNDKNFTLQLSAYPETIYFLNSLILECTSKKLHHTAFDNDMNIMEVQSLKGLYTALDSNSNMVGEDLKESDLKFWGKQKSFLKKETREWVNIDFVRENTDNLDYLLIDYSGAHNFKLPLKRQQKSSDAKKEKEEEDFNLKELNLKIYQWDGNSWIKLSDTPPLFKDNNRKVAIKFNKNLPLKFRIEVMSGASKINAVHLAGTTRVAIKKINIPQLPAPLQENDSEYLKLTPEEKFNKLLNSGKNNLCILKVNGYYEVMTDKNIPKGIDDIINRFLSKIKFW